MLFIYFLIRINVIIQLSLDIGYFSYLIYFTYKLLQSQINTTQNGILSNICILQMNDDDTILHLDVLLT